MSHPITPPPELVQQWRTEGYGLPGTISEYVATRAAQWGADQELEACCEWIPKATPWDAEQLRAARRPKPPSLKEQALEELDAAILRGDCLSTSPAKDTIRRALESIPDHS